MDYVSTRNRERKVSAAYAIANGIAPDGGLYCPTSFPSLTEADWKTLAESDYKGRSALILGKFLTDFRRRSWRTSHRRLTLTRSSAARTPLRS